MFIHKTKIQYAWDSTSLGYFKTCPRLYQYIIIEGWTSDSESVHLRFGQEYHRALEDFDKLTCAGATREDAIRQVVAETVVRTAEWRPDPDTKVGKYKNQDSLLRTIVDYLDYYANDPAKTYVKVDGTPAVEVSFNFELDLMATTEQPYLLCGHLDRVVEFNGDVYVMDRKTTTSTLGSHYFDQYAPHNQMSLYTFASQIVLDSPIKGVIIDAAQIMIDASRFVRGITYRSPDQIEEWIVDVYRWIDLAAYYAEEGYWPQNDTACDKFGGCRFREICSKSPAVREQYLHSHFTQLPEEERWNPLRPR